MPNTFPEDAGDAAAAADPSPGFGDQCWQLITAGEGNREMMLLQQNPLSKQNPVCIRRSKRSQANPEWNKSEQQSPLGWEGVSELLAKA